MNMQSGGPQSASTGGEAGPAVTVGRGSRIVCLPAATGRAQSGDWHEPPETPTRLGAEGQVHVETVVPAHAGSVTRLEVLHGFERMRRDLCMRMVGRTGISVGYEHLQFYSEQEFASVGPVLLSAKVIDTRAHHWMVEYVASDAGPRTGHVSRKPSRRVLAHARGVSLSAPGPRAAAGTLPGDPSVAGSSHTIRGAGGMSSDG